MNYRSIIKEGLWSNNAAMVQLLGLCPLLAISNSVVNATGLALATLLVITGSNISVSLSRQQIPGTIRLPVFVLIIATYTTCAELLLQAYALPLYQSIGIFIPLIVTNCMILGRAESFASRNPVLPALMDGLVTGLGFGLVLIILGGLREILGSGTLFHNMELLLPFTASWHFQLSDEFPRMLFAILPPGAFILLGLLVALKNAIDLSQKERESKQDINESNIQKSRRVRVTGNL